MTRKFLVASICVVALSVGAAAVASPAYAEIFQAGAYPAAVTGKATSNLKISNGTLSATCPNPTLTGNLAASSEILQLTANVAETECTSEGFYIRVTMLETPHLDWWFSRWTFIIPDYFIKWTSGRIKIDWWLTPKAFEEEKPALCTLEASEAGNTAVETVTGTNEGSGSERHMTMEVKSNNLLIKRVAGTEATCGKEKQSEGTLTGKFNFTASTEGKEPKEVGLWFE
jgi:hypothetical protein